MSDSRMRIWFSLFVLVVFCVGLAGGVLIGRRMPAPRPYDRAFRGPGPREFGPGPVGDAGRGGPPPPGRLLERLTSDLTLTADQQSKIQTILTESRTRVEGLQRETFDRFETERRGLRDEIRKILTPEQQEKFDKTEMDRGRFGRRGPPSPPR